MIVMLTVIDGLRPDAIAAADCPNLKALLQRSAYTLHARTVLPCITLPCHMSMFHGVPPTRHGVTSNDWQPMARPLPGLVDVAKPAGKRCAFFTSWEPLRDLSRPGALFYSVYVDNLIDLDADLRVAEAAAKAIQTNPIDFAFVYLGVVDNVGHDFGWMSDAYLAEVAKADRALGILLDALSDREHALLLQADHGGHERFHGLDIPEDMEIPWMVSGMGIRRGYEIPSPVTILDTAPTLARLLGVTPHAQWEGRCVEEIFEESS